MKILFIVGSLREKSFNRQLASAIKAKLVEKGVEVGELEYSKIPYMNQDIEFPAPSEIARVREEVMSADGIWIVTAEYNHSYPGVLKNLLDWLSRPLKPNDFASGSAIKGKKVALSGVAGRSAASGSIGNLIELLTQIRAEILKEHITGVSLTPDAFKTGVLTISDETLAKVDEEIDAFLKFLA